MRLKRLLSFVTAVILSTTVLSALPAGAVPAHVEESVIDEHPAFQSVPLGDNVPDAVKARAVEDALQEVNDPVGSPQEFEEAIARQIRDQTNSENTSQFRFVPAVIIGAKIAGCAAGAYTALSALDKHAPYAHNAMVMGNILVSCIGGGVAGKTVGNWMLKNPKTFGAILNAIGLGHLAGDSRQ